LERLAHLIWCLARGGFKNRGETICLHWHGTNVTIPDLFKIAIG
jgi:hypothetical protein